MKREHQANTRTEPKRLARLPAQQYGSMALPYLNIRQISAIQEIKLGLLLLSKADLACA
jgi:hypothetical protein